MTTKFQPTDARKAYPCMDEPDLKATFNVTMVHPAEYISLSNMPVESNFTVNGMTTTIFGKTVKMSTYLIAFIVCDFEYKENITGIGNNITVCGGQGEYDVQRAQNIFHLQYSLRFKHELRRVLCAINLSSGILRG